MLQRLKHLLTKTLYRQLVVGATLIMALTMTLFGWEMTRHQEQIEISQRTNQAIALANGLAISSSVWVAARDYSGLQEIVGGLARYPDLRHAMVLDMGGQILAHQDIRRRGQMLTDLPALPETRVLQLGPGLIDVASPVLLGGRHVGWVRVGLAGDSFQAELAKTQREAVLYTLFSVLLGGLFAALSVRYLVQRLHAVQRVANAVQKGELQLRAAVTGEDEAAELAGHFNAMLDRLAERDDALRKSEALLSATQHLGKIGGWEWDLEKQSMYWTPEIYRIHDMDPDLAEQEGADHIAQSSACYLPEDREKILAAFWRCVEMGEPYDLEVPFTTVKQRQLWIRTTGQAIRQGDRIVKVIGYIMDITQRRRMEDEIRSLAFYDPLTKLPNRRMFNDRLCLAMAASQRSGSCAALLYLDLDNFKPLNDAHGHDVGDLLLVEVAKRMTRCVREVDTVGRIGGDEFVAILGQLDADREQAKPEALLIAEKMRAALSEPYRFKLTRPGGTVSEVEHRCSASIGVVVFAGHEASQEDVMKSGDSAMYQAKVAGGNRVQLKDG
jgi:diguanylate cyclase (GGDEF)-like protein